MQFLMGLNETYEQTRGQILLMHPIPALNQAYSLVIDRESQKIVSDSPLNMVTNEFSAMMGARRGQYRRRGNFQGRVSFHGRGNFQGRGNYQEEEIFMEDEIFKEIIRERRSGIRFVIIVICRDKLKRIVIE